MRIGVLHPGEMGGALAAAIGGAEVAWCAAGRSAATRRRAGEAGLVELADLRALVGWADAVVSVCPPAAAADTASAVLDAGFRGLYVDANAVSPATARGIASAAVDAGAEAVDGGIVGPAPHREATTRLYLSGARADEVAGWFADGPLGTVVLSGDPGEASALKAGYAGWTKGSAALLVAVRAFARAHGVEEALLGEWDTSQPGLRERSEGSLPRLLATAWRFEGELREISGALADQGLPGGFHEAAAQVYARLAAIDGEQTAPDEVLDRLLGEG